MSSERERESVQFVPLHPVTPRRLIVAFVFGPIAWLVALIVAAALFNRSSAIALGLLVVVVSFLVSLVVLALLHAARIQTHRLDVVSDVRIQRPRLEERG